MSGDTGLDRVVRGLDGFALTDVELVGGKAYRAYSNALVGGLDAPEVVVDAFHVVEPGQVPLRLLVHCDGVNWHHQPAARIRGRAPRLTA